MLQGPLACDSMQRRDLALKRKRSRVAWTRGWARHLRQQGVRLIAFGNGHCNARGHRKMPIKQVIRHLASVIGVLVIDEFGTSSRCPTCKPTTKLTRDHGDITTLQVSEGEDSTEFDNPNVSCDLRIEICTRCNRRWEHNEVSVINLAHVTYSLLNRRARPSWLDRKNCKSN